MRSDREEFPRHVKEDAWKRCKGHCEHPACRQKIMNGAHYDHITPAALGGKATIKNCQVMCGRCHRLKTSERSSGGHMKSNIYIFFRADGFYPIELRDDEDARKNAEWNSGTLRVEDAKGRVVWRLQ